MAISECDQVSDKGVERSRGNLKQSTLPNSADPHLIFPAQPAFTGLKSAFASHARVVHALMLRDIKTRFGASYFGFLMGLFTPLAHIFILLTIYHVVGRRAALGTDSILFLATGLVPFIVWSYTHQKVIFSFAQNKPLTFFPIVKHFDMYCSAALVELLNSVLIVCVVMVVLSLMGTDLFIYDPASAFFGIALAYMFGVSTGAIFGIIALKAPGFRLVGMIMVPLYWVTCGTFFIPESLPLQVRWIVAWLPLSHVVDFVRESIYPSYTSDYHQISFVIACILANVIFALSIDRFLRAQLTTK